MGIREMRREKQARRMIRKDKVLSVQESNWLIMQMRLYGERRNRYVALWLCFCIYNGFIQLLSFSVLYKLMNTGIYSN